MFCELLMFHSTGINTEKWVQDNTTNILTDIWKLILICLLIYSCVCLYDIDDDDDGVCWC